MMSGIRGKNTRPELLIRHQLHSRGFHYRLHDKTLAGKPDIVFKKYKAVIFVHGCFWHRHECGLFKWPKSNSEFWRNKLNGNFQNDQNVINWTLNIIL
ncbi:MAG: DNA mismatch endonuclease Vsr [SAR324 cluster bacterium]|nr:DNA mismatch endonuclease Vsr [SAR324 cluster bacterium]